MYSPAGLRPERNRLSRNFKRHGHNLALMIVHGPAMQRDFMDKAVHQTAVSGKIRPIIGHWNALQETCDQFVISHSTTEIGY